MNKAVNIALALMALFLLVLVTLFVATSDDDFADKPIDFSSLGGDFTLAAYNGEVSLSDYHGKVVVMYFGFLSCPEVCPNSMTTISNALDRLSDEQAEQTQAILVSVDPKRDTPQKLADYVKYYHQSLIGLTGNKQQIDAVTNQYGAYYDFAEIESVTADYGVEHSSRYYVIDRNGELVTAMRHSTTPNELAAQVKELL